MTEMKIHAGTSGFAYREWIGGFYPKGLPAGKMLSFYASRFSAVEVNATFYRMPTAKLMEQWGTQVQAGFRFALKAPQAITHRKMLLQAEEETSRFLWLSSLLGQHLGPVLFQLPPFFPSDLSLLRQFLQIIAGTRAAFEFRHPSWLSTETYRLLEQYGCALCISDRMDAPEPPIVATANFGYLRLRRDRYSADDLKRWREGILAQGWEDAYVFFRHEETGEGTRLAERLLDHQA